MALYDDYLLQRPSAGDGVPIGYGDWRLVVQWLLPAPGAGEWNESLWDAALWSAYAWSDITYWVRGISWVRGTSTFGGIPEIGTCTITLDNRDRRFTPTNTTTSHQSATTVTTYEGLSSVDAGYMSPGSLLRVVAFSPSGQYSPILSPATLDTASGRSRITQFTGVVESWTADEMVFSDAQVVADQIPEATATVQLVETGSLVARVSRPGVTAVADNEYFTNRMSRLARDAKSPVEWRGAVRFVNPADGSINTSDIADVYRCQATTLAGNRWQEILLTAASFGHTVFSGRDGFLRFYPDPALLDLANYASGITLADSVTALAPVGAITGGGTAITAPYDPKSLRMANDDDPIINSCSWSNAGGAVQTATSDTSIGRVGERTETRGDLIGKSDALVGWFAAERVKYRSRSMPRVESLTLHHRHEYAWPMILSCDIHSVVPTIVLPGNHTRVRQAIVDQLRHDITPSPGGVKSWTTTISFGLSQLIEVY